MSSVKLTYDSNDYMIKCTSVSVGWRNNITASPNVNNTEVAEVHTNGFENPIYTLQGVMLVDETGHITYEDLLTLAKVKYDSTDADTKITLTVDYGKSSTDNLVASDGSTTAIPVIVKSFNFPISTNDAHTNSSNVSKYLPVGSIVLEETA